MRMIQFTLMHPVKSLRGSLSLWRLSRVNRARRNRDAASGWDQICICLSIPLYYLELFGFIVEATWTLSLIFSATWITRWLLSWLWWLWLCFLARLWFSCWRFEVAICKWRSLDRPIAWSWCYFLPDWFGLFRSKKTDRDLQRFSPR